MKLYPYFKLLCLACLLLAGGSRLYATTYRLVQVTSVEAGCKYVFVEGGRALKKEISSNILKYVNSYSTSNLTGNENYVWDIEAATGGFYIKTNDGKYLNFKDYSVDMTFEGKKTIWTFSFTDNIALISSTSYSISERFLGWNLSTGYKAYSIEHTSIYPHDFTVYQLVTDITVTPAKYATFCAEVGLDFSDTGAKVYTAKVENGKVKLTEIEGGIVPANTGILIYKDVNASVTISAAVKDNSTTVSNNELVGTIAETTVSWEADGKHNYILQTDAEGKAKFYKAKAEGAQLIANRAYLSTSASVSAHELDITFDEEGETTGISAMHNSECIMHNSAMHNEYYNLHGQRVNANHKGIVIVGGKKVFNP